MRISNTSIFNRKFKNIFAIATMTITCLLWHTHSRAELSKHELAYILMARLEKNLSNARGLANVREREFPEDVQSVRSALSTIRENIGDIQLVNADITQEDLLTQIRRYNHSFTSNNTSVSEMLTNISDYVMPVRLFLLLWDSQDRPTRLTGRLEAARFITNYLRQYRRRQREDEDRADVDFYAYILTLVLHLPENPDNLDFTWWARALSTARDLITNYNYRRIRPSFIDNYIAIPFLTLIGLRGYYQLWNWK